MKFASITKRLAGLGGAKWELHIRARALSKSGKDIIELTIGEPDVAMSCDLIDVATTALKQGRVGYSDGRGEQELRNVLADYYTKTSGRPIEAENILCFPGTQTALYAVMAGVAETGDEVLVGDPMYATYEAVIRASGAEMIPVPLRPENGFCMQADDVTAQVTDKTRALLLTTPHNPTGAILSVEEIEAIGQLALEHDFWIISDEVYAPLIFDGYEFSSPLSHQNLKDRVVVVSSISKSHAAPGLRSGWCVGPPQFIDALLPMAEAMLFGNQPFIADMTVAAIRDGSTVAAGMRERFAARAKRLIQRLGGQNTCLGILSPHAGMFALVDVTETGMTGREFALRLLNEADVAVMPGTSFGNRLDNWVRVALTVQDDQFDQALERIAAFTNQLTKPDSSP